MTHNISNTSIEAGRTMEPFAPDQLGRVLAFLASRRDYGAIDEEIAEHPTDEDSKCYPAGVRAAQARPGRGQRIQAADCGRRQSQSLACASRAARSWFLIPILLRS